MKRTIWGESMPEVEGIVRKAPWVTVRQESVADCTAIMRSVGQGEQPIVLVHGIGVSARYFEPLAAELARTSTVYAIELPGFGGTPGPRRALSVPELGEIVLAVLRKLELAAVVLVGHSMGCQVAAETAARAPELVSKLVLLGPTVNDRERSIGKQALRLAQDTLRESPKVNWVVFTDYLRSMIPYLKTLPTMMNHRLEDTLLHVSSPVVLMRGGRDPIVPADWLGRLAEANGHAAVIELDGAPHVLMYHRPAETAQGFLAGDAHETA
ncbi:pimeloyl-ACP methyl ester carboxylesterase [Arthrobacter pigmenti]|uniref:Pimeloyl-ACP methyl ester carboxylesterase n=1 Tax=Arthrobacter pigmenti TaxID=271432 RepID=A0A846RUC5_9MICC|nr:pimeloyl-ACP methyl ester carboxylesterase [Arthrobacter pigmenti]